MCVCVCVVLSPCFCTRALVPVVTVGAAGGVGGTEVPMEVLMEVGGT